IHVSCFKKKDGKHIQQQLPCWIFTLTQKGEGLETCDYPKKELGTVRSPAFPIHYLPANIKNIPSLDDLRKRVVQQQEKPLVDVLRVFDSRIQNITVVGDDVMVGMEQPPLLSVGLMGDGVIKAVKILSAIANMEEGGIVLIDEIDNGIHTSALAGFWKAIITFARTKNVQVFATTHSWESLEMLKSVLEENTELRDEVRCRTLVRESDDTIKNYAYDYDGLHAAVEAELDIR
ncbi:MAG: ATP-binding protein, partial [Verrucomicrobiota bacterium]|nr:ATP-binding protein [Verrucomicrobiota bacterium]